jgi:bifunctional N-acetylglucosamine-1-phosphate-uridyltransferase/glucosamine-1-phosphate-acetyltransferase GlmU-like protein
MTRVLVIPAAGLGSRLGGPVPKVLVTVAGVPMIDRLLALYKDVVSRAVLVLHPSFAAEVERHVAQAPLPVECLVQPSPTGMLDAITTARDPVLQADPFWVWITWCDQAGVDPRTIARLAAETERHADAALVMPTVTAANPYIHLERQGGRIVRILHRREGDRMPPIGESDMGLFAISRRAFRDLLPLYAADVRKGGGTGERNFLPFIPWADGRAETIVTFPSTDPREAIGVNTPDDLARVEAYIRSRA